MHVCFIGRNVHFLPSASASAVLPREIINSVYRYMDASLITIDNKETFERKLRENIDKRYKELSESIELIELMDNKEYIGNIVRIIKNKNFNIIHTFDLPPLDTLKIWKVSRNVNAKLIYHTTMPAKKIKGFFKATLLYRSADAVIASSPYVFRNNWVSFAKCAQVIPPPIDMSIYKPVREGSLSEDGFTLFYIGPLEHERFPIRSVVDIIRHLREINVKLIAAIAPRYEDDIQRVRLLKKIANDKGVGENIHVIYGRIPLKEKVSFFGSADVVFFPFLKSYKGAIDPPITLLEAMSCGGLVIASNVLSFPWVIKDKYNGFLYSTTIQLINNIKRIYNMNIAEEKDVRNNAFNTIRKHFSSSIVCEKLLSFYEKLLNK